MRTELLNGCYRPKSFIYAHLLLLLLTLGVFALTPHRFSMHYVKFALYTRTRKLSFFPSPIVCFFCFSLSVHYQSQMFPFFSLYLFFFSKFFNFLNYLRLLVLCMYNIYLPVFFICLFSTKEQRNKRRLWYDAQVLFRNSFLRDN